MQGSLKDFDLKIRDLKVYKGHGAEMKEQFAEEKTYNDRITTFKNSLGVLPYGQLIKKFPFLQGIPLSPFPRYTRCLGATPRNGAVRIRDRYV